jgi:hypothetical protein
MHSSCYRKYALALVASALSAATVVAAPEAPAAKAMDPMMEAMMKAGTPGEQHRKLAEMTGTWSMIVKMEEPGKPPTIEKGTATMKMVDDRYLHQEAKSSMMGMPFHGMGVTGFDNTTKKYQGTWFDNMSTGIMTSEGTMSPDGRTLTMTGQHADPMTGKMVTSRLITTMMGPDKHVFEMFCPGPDGKEARMMEITYERAK